MYYSTISCCSISKVKIETTVKAQSALNAVIRLHLPNAFVFVSTKGSRLMWREAVTHTPPKTCCNTLAFETLSPYAIYPGHHYSWVPFCPVLCTVEYISRFTMPWRPEDWDNLGRGLIFWAAVPYWFGLRSWNCSRPRLKLPGAKRQTPHCSPGTTVAGSPLLWVSVYFAVCEVNWPNI